MKLLISSNELKRFKRRASKAYPREIYALMFGKEVYGKWLRTYRVTKIQLVPAVESTYEYVIPDWPAAEKMVKEAELMLIVSIHTHPQAPSTLSKHDYDTWEKGHLITGILSIRKRNVLKTTELKFWGRKSPVPVKFKIIEGE